MTSLTRCEWSLGDPLMIQYHDDEWGVPVHGERELFEYFVLDAFQAGLSWLTILKKRENFRKAFSNFDYRKIARYGKKDFNRLMSDEGIIRNRLKIEATINNAQRFMEIQKEFGSFDKYIWQFTKGKSLRNRWKSASKIPTKTEESDLMGADLKRRGFKFVGSTICYAFMQAAGMVNDHTIDCFRYKKV
ncbi:MAG: DNA-3-methyladenine glycosylase I [Candidatus Colwellbacteria bacterium CG10_big_fil_rev_8_21_14_0_10_41_28]|uniref:DNA-3-methyladenine glycosylase I n=1 Tax=Candidatus Colwellbacteria bacterium CG10_big_fil_rev_8_21_14_0_10_41_28 TaxID=1974539 RepID=A0A2H0VH02_9BACT|nr:MAG: DNA-3-methyladenine glycosylase I [Candidatus Colwellbacteria bacterium CG10_big_fil_rev_8_21_14_0_10_41_28]